MTMAEVVQVVNVGGVLAFAYIVWSELRALRRSFETLASRIDYAAGANDETPARGIRIARPNGNGPKSNG